MKYYIFTLVFFLPIVVFSAGVGSIINKRALVSGGSLSSDTILLPGDAKLLGLNSKAKDFLQTVSLKPSSHVKGLNQEFAKRLATFVFAAKRSGKRIRIYSGYRSPEHQSRLFKAAINKYGSRARARKWVAPPGKSNHNRGIAVDLRFGSGAQSWAHKNAARYGLRFRMSHEPWHIEPNNRVTSAKALNKRSLNKGGINTITTQPYQTAAARRDRQEYYAPAIRDNGYNPYYYAPVYRVDEQGGAPASSYLSAQGSAGTTYYVPVGSDSYTPSDSSASFIKPPSEGGSSWLTSLRDLFKKGDVTIIPIKNDIDTDIKIVPRSEYNTLWRGDLENVGIDGDKPPKEKYFELLQVGSI